MGCDTRAGRPRQCGVTLLELLVALTLLSLVAWSVYAGIRTAGRSWEAASARTQSVEDLRVVSGVLRSHLSRAIPLLETTDRHRQVRFDGTRRQIDFLAELPPYLGLGGLQQVSIRVESDGRSSQLTMHRHSFEAESGTAQAPKPRILVDHLRAAEIDYFGTVPPAESPQWHTQWREQESLPTLVRLRIATRDGPWPDLVVQPMVDRPRELPSDAGGKAGDEQREPAPEQGSSEENQ